MDEAKIQLRDNPQSQVLDQLTSVLAKLGNPEQSFNEVVKSFYLDQMVGERSPHTIRFYKSYFSDFIKHSPSLADEPFANITVEHIQSYLLSKGNHVYAKNGAYRAFRALFYFAVRRQIIKENIMQQIKLPKLPKDTNIPIVKPEVFKALLKTCGPTFLGYRDRAIMMVLYDTGLRLSELAGMTFSKLDFENKTITVLGKGNKKRTVSFDEKVQRALFDYVKVHPLKSDVVWLTEEKRPITGCGIQQMFGKRRKMIDVKRLHPHMFRHSCAVNLLQAGMDIDSVMKYLGQETITVLQGYLKSLKSQNASELHKKYSPVRSILG